MNTTLVKMETKGHKGPLRFTIDMHRPGDLMCFADSHAKVNSDSRLWRYRYDLNLPKPMLFSPFKAFDENALTGKLTVNEIDKNAWQPEAIYA